ncbi:fatty acid desaturase [candidate division KSB1 bacterium]|nr:fatty acid desaturase [candidate division KSB1 bacterium]
MDDKALTELMNPYAVPSLAKSVWQLANSFLPFFAAIYLMYLSLAMPFYVTLGLGVLAAGFMVRMFIIQHDCGHGSFFVSKKLNDRVGYFCSLFTMVPYYYWRRQHALHHSTNGNLDQRGLGDMTIHTVKEYLVLSRFDKLHYRCYRHPLVFILFGPLALFFYINRVCTDPQHYNQRDRRNIWITNLTIAATLAAIGVFIGFAALAKVVLPVLFIAASLGIWLFYIQHQFEHTYWKPKAEWNYVRAAMQGSSYYKLPRILQWFTGNIGYHHIHHLKSSIPNYELERCYHENPEFHDVYTVTLFSSMKTMFLSVWDEDQQRLISFRELKRKYVTA